MSFPWSPFDFGPFDETVDVPASLFDELDPDVLAMLDGEHSTLEQAVWLSLFSNARAHPDDALPLGADRQGWWADTYAAPDEFGSRLWLLDRAVVTQATVLRARDYAQEALAWMVADGLAVDVQVVAERMPSETSGVGIALAVTVTRGDQTPAQVYRFADIWSVING